MTTDHGPYMSTVEQALVKAGFAALDSQFDDFDPRGGGIQLDMLSPSGVVWPSGWDELWLVWAEQSGWCLVFERRQGDDRRHHTVDLAVGKLPSPNEVVAVVGQEGGLVLSQLPDDGYPSLEFRDHQWDNDDDVEFEQALARYAEPAP